MTGEAEIALLTGGFDKPYVFGLAMALSSKGVRVDVIAGDDVDSPEMHTAPNLNFLNLRGRKGQANAASKAFRLMVYYGRLVRYAATTQSSIFHILWNNKFEFFDRTVLMLYYKLLGKRIVLTAHNVNAGKRDSNDSLLNRLTLRTQYLLTDHVFVHTERMKRELLVEFGMRSDTVSVIPFGINNSVPNTDVTPSEARRFLGIGEQERVILFFGAIVPYKGLEYLSDAFLLLAAKCPEYRLIIAGEPRKQSKKYFDNIQRRIIRDVNRERIIQRIQYIPDEQTELYFKAADVLALPYTHVFQSGVLFLAYSFGLPVVATDVGSVRDEIIEGATGLLCKPRDSFDMAQCFENYFQSDLYKSLASRRKQIRDYANSKHSWQVVGELTRNVYSKLLTAHK